MDFEHEVLQRLTRIETLGEQKCRDLDDHESRIRGLERFKWKRDGVAIVAAFIVPIALTACIKIWG